jgi:hypothetical protein
MTFWVKLGDQPSSPITASWTAVCSWSSTTRPITTSREHELLAALGQLPAQHTVSERVDSDPDGNRIEMIQAGRPDGITAAVRPG